ncbi:M23 family metallopeptidase [Nocardiopsis sp. N85]|uniref:M23 family metallopeptidase n=1 Tax=Nocardiopsis sp. N85 TaxID=3029400 RepID=UPI00237FB7DD|nr:M23 family metallopeptidase [Nocardiopsis sp. N85]MDE3721592.1 M23 family metallopeptidase [Nocardiopsis sp. N85]
MRSLLLLLLCLLFLFPVPVAAETVWRWPLDPPPRVLRPFEPPEFRWSPGHRGVDLTAEPAQEVLAAGSGRVHFAGTVAGTPVVSISHGELRTTYLPVESDLARGDPVTIGQVIGTIAADPRHCPDLVCLHWGLRRGPDYLDPLSLLGPIDVRLLPRSR